MKITKQQLRKIVSEAKSSLLSEAHPDGRISPGEDDEREDLMIHVEMTLNDLIQTVKDEADRIGGPFRSPGIKHEAFKLMRETIQEASQNQFRKQ